MIKHQHEYESYLKEMDVGSNDKVADSIRSYVSYLNSVSKHLDISIDPSALASDVDVNLLSEQLKQARKVSKKTISNYRSAMNKYVSMVNQYDLLEYKRTDFRAFDVKELLQYQASIITELKRRNVVRTQNNPLGDYTEWLVANSLELKLASNSRAGYDGIGKDGLKVQVKGRRITSISKSRQLSAIRNYEEKDFDELAAVIFDESFNVIDAVLIPHDVVGEYARYQQHVNAHNLLIQGPILRDSRVKCIKQKLLVFERSWTRGSVSGL